MEVDLRQRSGVSRISGSRAEYAEEHHDGRK